MKIFILSFLLFTTIVNSGENTSTKVSNTGVNSKGMVFVTFADPLTQEGCDQKNQLILPPDSSIQDKVLSIAISAKISQSDVIIKPEGCFNNSPSLLEGTEWGWFYII